jgi:hypothetical protein
MTKQTPHISSSQDKKDLIIEHDESESEPEPDQNESLEDQRSSQWSGRYHLDVDSPSHSLEERFDLSQSSEGNESDSSLRERVSIDEISLSQSSRSSPIFDDCDSGSLSLPQMVGHHHHRSALPSDESLSSDPFSTDREDSKA